MADVTVGVTVIVVTWRARDHPRGRREVGRASTVDGAAVWSAWADAR